MSIIIKLQHRNLHVITVAITVDAPGEDRLRNDLYCVEWGVNTRTAEQLIYLQQPDASIDAPLLGPASLRLRSCRPAVHSHSLAVD